MTHSATLAHRRSLDSVFRPRSVAIVGASDRPGSRGAELLSNLRSIGYPGTIMAVNPSRSEVAGIRCFPTLGDLPEVPALVAIGVSAERTLPVVEQAMSLGAGAIAIVGAGYAESGTDGARLQAEIAERCARRGVALCGPNCLGVWSRLDRMSLWLAEGSPLPLSGLGLVIQSGALASSLMDPLQRRGIAFDVIATVGNEAGVTTSDYLAEMVEDPRVRAVAVVIEAIRNVDGFLTALQTARSAGKPVFVVKLGRSETGRRAALAHTASIAGDHDVARAVLRQYGAEVVEDLDRLLESLVLASRFPDGVGERILYVTVSGAGAGLVADLVSAHAGAPTPIPTEIDATIRALMPGVELSNPLDVAMAGDRPGLFAQCIDAAAACPDIDGVAVALNVPFAVHSDGTRFYVEQVDALAAVTAAGKPAVAFTLTTGAIDPAVVESAVRAGVALLMGADAGVRALVRRRPASRAGRQPRAGRGRGELPPSGPAILDELHSKRILASWGLTVVEEVAACTADDAVEAAARIGYPVAVKVVAEGLVHKSDVGGVRTDLRSAGEVRRAFHEIIDQVATQTTTAPKGAVVQRQVEGGTESIIGIKRDDIFGPVVVLGWGGIFVEVLRELTIRRVPIGTADAHEMIAELRGAAILTGARGRPPADVEALAEALVCLSDFAVTAGERVEAVDVNPILVGAAGHGAVVVDAMIQTRAIG